MWKNTNIKVEEQISINVDALSNILCPTDATKIDQYDGAGSNDRAHLNARHPVVCLTWAQRHAHSLYATLHRSLSSTDLFPSPFFLLLVRGR